MVKVVKDYMIGTEAMIEMDCLPILGVIFWCVMPNLAMLMWIVYIISMSPKVLHISRKNNAMTNMLSKARYEYEGDIVLEDEDVTLKFFKMT